MYLQNGSRTRNYLHLASQGGEETNNALIMLEGVKLRLDHKSMLSELGENLSALLLAT